VVQIQATRAIPRVWEVNWAIPSREGGRPWESYDWLLKTAAELGADEVSIVAATYGNLGHLSAAVSKDAAARLRVKPHAYRHRGITVHGISQRGDWYARGPVLMVLPDDEIMAEVEGQRPPAIAAVASWPNHIATWRSVYNPPRIGQVRAEQEAKFDTVIVPSLDPRAADVIDSVAVLVNEWHAVLDIDEREDIAGALIALSDANVSVEGLRAHLMRAGWQGELIENALELARRVARGERPRHHHYPLRAAG
jgi:hypothetical protein